MKPEMTLEEYKRARAAAEYKINAAVNDALATFISDVEPRRLSVDVRIRETQDAYGNITVIDTVTNVSTEI